MSDPATITFLFFIALVAALMALCTLGAALYWLRKARRTYIEAERNVWRAQARHNERERL